MTEHPTDDLGLYALGLLDEDERRAIAQHLPTCPTCRAELATRHDRPPTGSGWHRRREGS